MKGSVLVVLSALCAWAAPALPAPASRPSGQVDVWRTSFDDVFAGLPKFYPGQKVTIRIKGTVDPNHRYWESRECNWFGLNCWYEKREASNFMDANRLPVALRLVPSEKLTDPVHVNDVDRMLNNAAHHLPIPADATKYEFTIDAPNSDTDFEAFATGFTLQAMIADKYDKSISISRSQCHNRPATCSTGAYTVEVGDIDNSIRLGYLQGLLDPSKDKRRTAAELKASGVLDPFFIEDKDPKNNSSNQDSVKKAISKALFEHAKHFHRKDLEKDKPDKTDFLDIAAIALSLGPDKQESVAIQNDIAWAYLKLGNVFAASQQLQDSLRIAKANYDNPKNRQTVATYTDYAQALRLRASIWMQERVGMYGADMTVAVSLYQQAATICADAAPNLASKDGRFELYKCAYEALVDASRTLSVLRTREHLEMAEAMLIRAIGYAKKAVGEN